MSTIKRCKVNTSQKYDFLKTIGLTAFLCMGSRAQPRRHYRKIPRTTAESMKPQRGTPRVHLDLRNLQQHQHGKRELGTASKSSSKRQMSYVTLTSTFASDRRVKTSRPYLSGLGPLSSGPSFPRGLRTENAYPSPWNPLSPEYIVFSEKMPYLPREL